MRKEVAKSPRRQEEGAAVAVTHRGGVLVLVLLGQSGAGPGLPGFGDTVLVGVWLAGLDSVGPLWSRCSSYVTLAEWVIAVLLLPRYVILLEVCPEGRRRPFSDKREEEEEISIRRLPSEVVFFSLGGDQ